MRTIVSLFSIKTATISQGKSREIVAFEGGNKLAIVQIVGE